MITARTNRTGVVNYTRSDIATDSKTFEQQLLPKYGLNDYSEKMSLANHDGNKISEKYANLLIHLANQPENEKKRTERADVHYDYAFHLSIMRTYFYLCFKQANTREQRDSYLKMALVQSEELLEQIEYSYGLYTKQKDKEETQVEWDSYKDYHEDILTELSFLNETMESEAEEITIENIYEESEQESSLSFDATGLEPLTHKKKRTRNQVHMDPTPTKKNHSELNSTRKVWSSNTRLQIARASSALEVQLTPADELENYVELEAKAERDGGEISTQYNNYIEHLNLQPATEKSKTERANTHYDYAVHLSILRIYYYYCFEQAVSIEEQERYLNKALDQSSLLLEHSQLAYDLYKKPVDKELTQKIRNAYLIYHQVILVELNKLHPAEQPLVQAADTTVNSSDDLNAEELATSDDRATYADVILSLAPYVNEQRHLPPKMRHKSSPHLLSIFYHKQETDLGVNITDEIMPFNA